MISAAATTVPQSSLPCQRLSRLARDAVYCPLTALRDALGARDEEAARRICHRFRGGAGAVGAELLSSLCTRYEAGEVPLSSAAQWLSEVVSAVDAFVRESESALTPAQA